LGGDDKRQQISAYELYSVDFGSSADKVFATMDMHPFVAGGFAWSGWDYLGEPTPYYLSRSSYFGIIDLAGFKKDRFYLYQSRWRPELRMAHILPHWNWQEQSGQVVPVHVFTSGDEAELFLNGKTLGRKKMGQYEYRLRWDSVRYVPGELKIVAYKDGKVWAEDSVKTTGKAVGVSLSADHQTILADGKDLSFITLRVTDKEGITVPRSKNAIKFSIEGPAELVATDNGDAANLVSFRSSDREAFNGLCLVIVRGKSGQAGAIKLKAESEGLDAAVITLKSVNRN
jgi:beta-galactosidase